MPYPIALAAGLALSAAGAGMQMAGNARSKSAMNDAQNAELLRQKKFQQEADASFQQNVERSRRTTAEAEQEAGADRRLAEAAALELTGAGMAAPITAPASGSANPNSAAAAAQRSATATRAAGSAWSRLVGNAKARLGGGDDWQLAQAIGNNRTNLDLGITANQARGSAALLPYEMEEAQHRGDALRGWGQLVGALGAVTGAYGATAGAGAAAAAPSASGWSAINWTPEMAASFGAIA